MATIQLSATTVEENAGSEVVIGTLSVDDAAGEEFTFELVDDFGGRFKIVGDQLLVADGSLLNYEDLSSFELEISAESKDAETPTDVPNKFFTIDVTDVNEAPTDLVFTGGMIAEDAQLGTDVATLTGLDPDADTTLTYAIVDQNGERIDNSLFEIVGNKLQLKAGLDQIHVGTHTLSIMVTDGGETTEPYIEQITITVTDAAEVFGGTSGKDKITGTAYADAIDGGNGNDTLYGLDGNDDIDGGSGKDKVYGGNGDDVINGGSGKDKLYGGAGKDTFVFDSPVKKGHFDRIYDFNAKDDVLQFDLTDFRAFKSKASKADGKKEGDDDKGPKGGDNKGSSKKSVSYDKIFKKGKLDSKHFSSDTKLDSNDYLYYNKKNGIVYFDVDGSGKEKSLAIVQLKPGDDFSRSDFYFI
ncbi:calcium-binding protein [Microvirga roseola]|uniref:calcium-binding protein n=1 Tax=Microvirga roseola TaxID=2883126 RepID=UPI001E619239|nr:hypothetical protein [Microvirga roseola]